MSSRISCFVLIGLAVAAAVTGAPVSAQENGPDRIRGSEYIIGPEDTLLVQARDVDDMPKNPVRVDLNGDIRLPLVGSVHAAGLTLTELEKAVSKELEHYIINPDVVISIAEFKSQPVSVLGAVKNPGIVQVQGRKSLVEALSMAGGLREDAGQKIMVSRRSDAPVDLPGGVPDATGKFKVAAVSVDAILSGRDPAVNFPVMPNDVITVPIADLVYVLGEVKKPGGFTIRKEEQVSALLAISMAEGLLRTASAKNTRIMRKEAGSVTRKEIPVDLSSIMAGRAPDIQLQPDDIVFVPNSIPKNAMLRGLETAIQVGTGLVIWRR